MALKLSIRPRGIVFKKIKHSASEKIESIPLPKKAIILLKQGYGLTVKPLVRIGDKVKRGQVIGIDDSNISSPVHSTVNGTVISIEQIAFFKKGIQAITIGASDSDEEYVRLEKASRNWRSLSAEDIERIIYMSGAASLDKEGVPTHYKSSIISPDEVKDVIIRAVFCETFNVSIDALLSGEHLHHFIEGLEILKIPYPAAKFHLAITSRRADIIEKLKKLISDKKWIKLYTIEPRYPAEYEEVLLPLVLKKSFPYGYSSANIGVIVLSVRTILHIYDAVVYAKPVLDRLVPLSGSGWRENIHIKVPIGTSIGEVIETYAKKDSQALYISNSVLIGNIVSDFNFPVDRKTSNLISLTYSVKRDFMFFMRPGFNEISYSNSFINMGSKEISPYLKGEERSCISCGYCADICPVNIYPHLLAHYTKKGIISEDLADIGLYKCIECGLCTFVCPSKIKIMSLIKEGKEKLNAQGFDRSKYVKPYMDLIGLEEYQGIK